jgi:hypothetical protein
MNLRLDGEDGEHETDLCSNHGYTLLCDWIGTLPAESYPALTALADDGNFEGTDGLAEQMEAALADSPPEDPDVRHTVERLLDLLGDGRPDETATIEA